MTSDPADDGSSDLSVLDFLYHDGRRIGSFLSQFEGDGHLQQMTRTKDGSRGKKEASSHDVKGSLGVASGKLQGGTETTLEMNEGYVRVFDPYWANARAFLDYLSERELLATDLTAVSVGQFVLAKGWLTILDLAMFKDAWKLPTVQRKIKEGAFPKATATMTSAQKAQLKESRENADMMLEMIQIMPHSVHASLLTTSNDQAHMLWCTLKEEYLVTAASDLTLAHGATLPGEWSIVGILSARPEYMTPDPNSLADDSEPGVMQSVVGQVSKTIAPIVRLALGRPAAAHAITPILIFREVA